MTTTRENIIHEADYLVRNNGYNAFSFKDISYAIGIKTASIHYHFPTKSDLAIAVLEEHLSILEKIRECYKDKTSLENLDKFLSIYSQIKKENKVCIVGSLATDLNTVDEKIKTKLKTFALAFLDWVTEFLEKGRKDHIFHFDCTPRTKALLIISNMLAILQLSRLTGHEDFENVKKTIKNELLKK